MIGPDEQIYIAQASAIRAGGLTALRDMADEYLEEPNLQAYPSPLRWLWGALVAVTLPLGPRALQYGSAALMGPAVYWATRSPVAAIWAMASPLVQTLCRRCLQDVPVALATIVAIGCALHHAPASLAIAIAATLSMKEGAVYGVPAFAAAWLVSGGEPLPLTIALASGVGAWAVGLFAIFGRRVPAMMRTAASGHATQYAAQHQRGAPHRLLVDVMLASPMAVLFGAAGAAHALPLAAGFAMLIAAHATAPVRNVRLVLAADVVLRAVGAVAMHHPFIELPIALAIDALIALRIRHVYDPVTAAMTDAFGMSATTK